MKTPLFFAALLFAPLLSPADDAALPVPAAPAAAAETPASAPGAAAFRQQMLEKFDADKDGKFSDTERETAKAAWKEKRGDIQAMVLKKFDANKDGQLSETERQAVKAAFKARREGKGGDGEKGGAKAAERQQKMLEKFDTDKDGQLNEAERAKAREARKAGPGTNS